MTAVLTEDHIRQIMKNSNGHGSVKSEAVKVAFTIVAAALGAWGSVQYTRGQETTKMEVLERDIEKLEDSRKHDRTKLEQVVDLVKENSFQIRTLTNFHQGGQP